MKPPETLHQWPEYKYLSPWLQVATKGLWSKARVHEEVTAHFHDALEEGLRAGLTEDLAAEQAVKSLGSPKAARRAFRRTSLTRYQEILVRDLAEPRKRMWFLRVCLVLAATFLTLAFPRRAGPEWYVSAGMIALMAIAIVLLTAVPGLYRRGQQRAAIALGAGADTLLWALWAGFFIAGARFDNRWWFLLALLVWMGVNYLPLLPKLDKDHPQRA